MLTRINPTDKKKINAANKNNNHYVDHIVWVMEFFKKAMFRPPIIPCVMSLLLHKLSLEYQVHAEIDCSIVFPLFSFSNIPAFS